MGSSHSSATATNNVNQTINNETDLKVIQENIYKDITNIITNDAKACGSSLAMTQTCGSDISAKGDIILGGGNQSQSGALNFSCVQMAKNKNTIAQKISNNVTNELLSRYGVVAMAELGAKADAAASSGFISLGSSSSDTTVNNNYNLTSNNKINKTLNTIINNSIERNFTTNNMQSCISNVALDQNKFTNIHSADGSVKITCGDQEQKATLISNCIQEDETINSTLSEIQNILQTINNDTAITETKASANATGTSTAKSAGLDDLVASFFDGFSNVFKSLGELVEKVGMYIIIAIVAIGIIALIMYITTPNDIKKDAIH
jgi:hypothetical protein